jgi:hypothetical protein
MSEPEPAEYVFEIVTPRTNAARLSAAENLFSALALAHGREAEPIALEIVADGGLRRFQLRTTTVTDQQRIGRLLGAAYPQADLRPFGASDNAAGDAARQGPDERCAVSVLRPRRGEYLPLRVFVDRDLDGRSASAQADPLLGVLSALVDLPSAWRALVQLVVAGPAPADWTRRHQRLALERPLDAERARDSGPSPVLPLGLVGLVILYVIASSGLAAWRRGDWLTVSGLGASALLLAVLTITLARWFGRREIVDPRQVQAKLERDACLVELRLAVFAPEFADESSVYDVLEHVAAAYRAYSSGAGNSLSAQVINDAPDLRLLAPLGRPYLLNVQELAGLWHLVQATDDVPFVERTRARRRLPLPETVAGDPSGDSCRIGVSAHQGHAVPVHLQTALLNRHLLAVAKTRRGKSSLLLRLAQHLMTTGTNGAGNRAGRGLILVDPHRDLASAALGLVPRHRQADVVYLDISNRRRPFGINLLDAGLGWDRDQATANALRIFRREFDGFWGPRMEDAFRFAVLALFEANQTLCAEDPRLGRNAQHTILEVPAILERRGFRQYVLKRSRDPVIRDWFEGYFDALDTRQRLEIINPVQTKVHKYLGNLVARQIVGQPKSTIDFRRLIERHQIVLVNLNAFDVGEDVAALVGGTLLNLAARAISSQATLPPDQRQPVTLIVDEFHTIPGADYEQVFGELAKYGANMILATQTLSRLDRLTDAQRQRDLRAAVFSNLDGLLAFHTSAEDATYLADELGGDLDAQDLLELGHFACYARVTDMRSGERLPTFSVHLDPPPVGISPTAVMALARLSAEQYGRDALDAELDLQSAMARVRGPQKTSEATERDDSPPEPAPDGSGAPREDGVVAGRGASTS